MAARFPRFIITVDGQQASLAANHDEAWLQALTLWRPGCVVGCIPTEVSIPEVEPGEQAPEPPQADQGPGSLQP